MLNNLLKIHSGASVVECKCSNHNHQRSHHHGSCIFYHNGTPKGKRLSFNERILIQVRLKKARTGQAAYEQHCSACGSHFDKLSKSPFLECVDSHVREDKWSLDACFGKALLCGEFERSEVVCAKTLYNYVDLGLMEARNHHLPVKLRRSTEDVQWKWKTVRNQALGSRLCHECFRGTG